MPTAWGLPTPADQDPRRWARCLRESRAEVAARGIFDSHRRYHDIVQRGALKRFRAGVSR